MAELHDHDEHAHDHEHRAGLVARLRDYIAPHSHDASDRIDDVLETSRRGIRALWVSLLGLVATAAVQVVVVIASGSVALLGDTLHNVADALTAVPLWLAFTIGRRQPTRRYTYGFGRAEDLAGIFIVAMIVASAGVAAYESVERLLHRRDVHHLWAVALAAAAGFVGNEVVAWYRIRVGREIGSAALVADGLHARTDGLTSLAVVVGAGGVALGWDVADPVVGLLITVAILFVLRGAARDVYRRLMDAVDPDILRQAEATVAAVSGVEEVEKVRLRWIGHRLHAEADIIVDADLGMTDAHDIAVRVHHALVHDVARLHDATVHVNPCGHGGVDHHREVAHHSSPRRGHEAG